MVSRVNTVLVAGGTGFVGSHIMSSLEARGYFPLCISRTPGPDTISWDHLKKSGLPPCKAIINVAGENILDPFSRWDTEFKGRVWSSRVGTTSLLNDLIQNARFKPEVFVSISGVGIYQPSLSKDYDEYSEVYEFDYLSKLAIAWEKAGTQPSDSTVHHAIIRSGVVLGRSGGMINQSFLPFYFGLGGPIGSGKQYFPWIHVHDLAKLFSFIVENKLSGVFNGVSPHIINNQQFSKAFASALKRPAIIPVPSFALNLIFSEERAKVMTSGQKVHPKRVLESKFNFMYPTIEEACKEFSHLIYN